MDEEQGFTLAGLLPQEASIGLPAEPPLVAGPAMPTPPTPPGPMGPAVPQGLTPALLALPFILKGRAGGMGAAAAFLQGLQQAHQQKAQNAQRVYQNQSTQFEQQRQLVGDQRAQAQLEANAKWRADQQTTAQGRYQAQALANAAQILSKNPDMAGQMLPIIKAQLAAAGVRDTSSLDQVAQTLSEPTAVEKRWAEKQLQAYEKAPEHTRPGLSSATFTSPTGTGYHLADLYRVARGMSNVTPGANTPKPDQNPEHRLIQLQSMLDSGKDETGQPLTPEKRAAYTQEHNSIVAGHRTWGTAVPPAAIRVEQYTENQTPMNAPTGIRPVGADASAIDKKTGLSSGAMYDAAVTYITTGQFPPTGMGSTPRAQNVRAGVLNTASAIAGNAGKDIPSLRAEYGALSGSLKKRLPTINATVTASKTADDNLDLALKQSAAVSRTGSPLVNRYLQWANGHALTGNPALTEFETYIYTAAREYAKVTSGGAASAQGLTDSASKEAERLLNAAQTPQAFAAAVTAMRNDMKNVVGQQRNELARTSGSLARVVYGDAAGEEPTPPPATTTPGLSYQDYLNSRKGRR